ncbi:hypothetical protein F7R91_25550 [Streptomyces luteolifulvus]|uniref:Caspase family protein n=1 Tax=Streptomyces luteolifulvus TaxID=2615112 RepID=A0A6H9UX82_9ACTN|nr:hypothetical protein [Streptomyces luteolifulvus]KAB1143511.1 hypothetical protein F7R91_25550 [Streptomyces luteolifulvus]
MRAVLVGVSNYPSIPASDCASVRVSDDIDALHSALGSARAGELLVVYYAGHGLTVEEEHERLPANVQAMGQLSTTQLLSMALGLQGAKSALDDAQAHWPAADLTRRLLCSSEEETRLPSITTSLTGPTAVAQPGPLPTGEVLAHTAEIVQLLWLATVDLLAESLGSHRYEFDSHAPPHASTACGVIKLAAPAIPRAPGQPAPPRGSSGPFSSIAPAA